MSKKRKLQYKDLDALRFLAFLPIFFYCALYLLSRDTNSNMIEFSRAFSFIKQNSLDFFFFLSAFLLTSHGLRELKYENNFSLKSFYIRRALRIIPIFLIVLVFTFLIHPWIISMLKLTAISVPNSASYFFLFPNYFANISAEQYIYIAIIWSIYMFIQFYVFWGAILKFFINQIKVIGIVLIGLGMADRIYHVLIKTPFEFDTLSAGIPVGIGALSAHILRNDERFVELIKNLSKGFHLLVYLVGITIVLLGYLYFGNTYAAALIPILTCTFFAYVIFEQTYSKTSIFKLRKSKLLTRLGKISYGLIVYQSIIMVLGVIAIDSLELGISSIPVQVLFVVVSFLLSWGVADFSYNLFERPILAIKKEFKRS